MSLNLISKVFKLRYLTSTLEYIVYICLYTDIGIPQTRNGEGTSNSCTYVHVYTKENLTYSESM